MARSRRSCRICVYPSNSLSIYQSIYYGIRQVWADRRYQIRAFIFSHTHSLSPTDSLVPCALMGRGNGGGGDWMTTYCLRVCLPHSYFIFLVSVLFFRNRSYSQIEMFVPGASYRLIPPLLPRNRYCPGLSLPCAYVGMCTCAWVRRVASGRVMWWPDVLCTLIYLDI